MEFVPITDIEILDSRQRRYIDLGGVIDLADDIRTNGLMHAPVLRADSNKLVAGERRITALQQLYDGGNTFEYHGQEVQPPFVPITRMSERSELGYFEAELSENLARMDLTWQERAIAISDLHEMRSIQRGDAQTMEVTAAELNIDMDLGVDATTVANCVEIAGHFDEPLIADANSLKEANKILRIMEKRKVGERLAETFKESTGNPHKLLMGDATELLCSLPENTFDVLITDPPYGIDAQGFGDQTTINHEYDDAQATWAATMQALAKESFRLCKQQAHAYVFCDITRFAQLTHFFWAAGWVPWPRPLIWDKGNVGTIPRPSHGPRYVYEAVLYCLKGDKEIVAPGVDVLKASVPPRDRHAAEKSVDLYVNLLRRSCLPGDYILDPFCGVGTVFPAANILSLAATGIELSPASFGLASERLEECRL